MSSTDVSLECLGKEISVGRIEHVLLLDNGNRVFLMPMHPPPVNPVLQQR